MGNMDVEVDVASLLGEVRRFDEWLQTLPLEERKRLAGEYLNARMSMGILQTIETVKKLHKEKP